MTDEQLETAASIFLDEMSEWKIVEHEWCNVHAVRSCGKLVQRASREEAEEVGKLHAAAAMLAFVDNETGRIPRIQSVLDRAEVVRMASYFKGTAAAEFVNFAKSYPDTMTPMGLAAADLLKDQVS